MKLGHPSGGRRSNAARAAIDLREQPQTVVELNHLGARYAIVMQEESVPAKASHEMPAHVLASPNLRFYATLSLNIRLQRRRVHLTRIPAVGYGIKS